MTIQGPRSGILRSRVSGGAALRVPPRMATWFLVSLGAGPFVDSLLGDLIEEYQRGRSPYWYWRQVAVAVVMARTRFLRVTVWTTVDRLVAAFAMMALGLGTLTWAGVVKSDAEVPRQQVVQTARCGELGPIVGSSDCSRPQPSSPRNLP